VTLQASSDNVNCTDNTLSKCTDTYVNVALLTRPAKSSSGNVKYCTFVFSPSAGFSSRISSCYRNNIVRRIQYRYQYELLLHTVYEHQLLVAY
jgi:hypothetical protein